MLKSVSIGSKYIDAGGKEVIVKAIAETLLIYECVKTGAENFATIYAVKEHWSIPPRPKKRYWRWDVDGTYGIRKPSNYIDENGKTTVGRQYVNKKDLIYKYENEFIEVDC